MKPGIGSTHTLFVFVAFLSALVFRPRPLPPPRPFEPPSHFPAYYLSSSCPRLCPYSWASAEWWNRYPQQRRSSQAAPPGSTEQELGRRVRFPAVAWSRNSCRVVPPVAAGPLLALSPWLTYKTGCPSNIWRPVTSTFANSRRGSPTSCRWLYISTPARRERQFKRTGPWSRTSGSWAASALPNSMVPIVMLAGASYLAVIWAPSTANRGTVGAVPVPVRSQLTGRAQLTRARRRWLGRRRGSWPLACGGWLRHGGRPSLRTPRAGRRSGGCASPRSLTPAPPARGP
jgi:hypothetical protein